jgi:hypothetical protein
MNSLFVKTIAAACLATIASVIPFLSSSSGDIAGQASALRRQRTEVR